jgi:two-component system, chemotaxis family, protein-glutamate methylesterase/glutaminase
MSDAGASSRVLVCDESEAYARALAQFLSVGGELEVVGVCGSGEEVVGALDRLTPDLVTVDLGLPGMGGVQAIEEIMRARPVPIVVVSSGAGRGSDLAARALAAGAIEALPKTVVKLDEPDGAAAVALRHRLRRLARAGPAQRSNGAPRPHRPRTGSTVVGICASAGGPRALEIVLAGLPGDFPLPVLAVQHISTGFIVGLVDWLDRVTALPVGIARDGQLAGPGVWFPPDDTHLLLDASMRFVLDRDRDVGAHRPSADVLLESMASSAGAGAVGVMLTGMGQDGARGVDAICRAGGLVIAQDEETSALFGMPRAAAEAGAELVLPLPRIAEALLALPTKEGGA